MAKTLSNTSVFLGGNIVLRQEGIKKLRRFFIYLLTVLVFFSGIFFIVWEEIYIMKLTYEIHQLRRNLKELNFNNKKLKFEISTLSSLSRIEKEAVSILNLKSPESEQVKVIVSSSPDPMKLFFDVSLGERLIEDK